MKPLISALSLCFLTFGFFSCSKNDGVSPPDLNLIKNIQWRLIAFDSLAGAQINLNPMDTIFLFLEEGGIARGKSRGLCGNYYDGVYYYRGGNQIRFDSLVSTEAACPDSRYWDYYERLERVTAFGVDGSRLYLYFDAARKKLVFEKMP